MESSRDGGGPSAVSVVSSFEGGKRKPIGEVLYTGPDGIGDHKVKVEEQRYTGHTCASPEATGDVKYICRGAKNCPHPLPKTALVGEVGWGVPGNTDGSLLGTGHQIQLKEFRQANEDRYTHRYQTPFYGDIKMAKEAEKGENPVGSIGSAAPPMLASTSTVDSETIGVVSNHTK